MPSVWSISASVTRTPSIGTCRIVEGVSSARSQRNWSRTSGDAFRRNHRRPSPLTAAEDCVRGWAAEGLVRATRQRGHQQFHWGNPPPAALPSRRTCTPARGGAHGSPAAGILLSGRVRGHFHRYSNDGELGLRPFHKASPPRSASTRHRCVKEPSANKPEASGVIIGAVRAQMQQIPSFAGVTAVKNGPNGSCPHNKTTKPRRSRRLYWEYADRVWAGGGRSAGTNPKTAP